VPSLGQFVEAAVVDGVEDAANHPERPVHTHLEYGRPDDVPPARRDEKRRSRRSNWQLANLFTAKVAKDAREEEWKRKKEDGPQSTRRAQRSGTFGLVRR
jgi:hypothetical protein